MTWEQAKDACLERGEAELAAPGRSSPSSWDSWARSGMLLCFVGVLVTAPVAMIALAYAYEKAFGPPPPPARRGLTRPGSGAEPSSGQR